MNSREQSDFGIHGIPLEVEEEIIHMIRTTPQVSIPLIHVIYQIAAVAFEAGVDAGLNKAILRIEETNIKLQSLAN